MSPKIQDLTARLGTNWIALQKKTWGYWLEKKLKISQLYALAAQANDILSCNCKTLAIRLRKIIVLLCLAFLRPHVECCASLSFPATLSEFIRCCQDGQQAGERPTGSD